MKFPKSMHPEGFYDHLDKTASAPAAQPPRTGVKPTVKAGARPLTGGGQSLLRSQPLPPPTAPAAFAPAVAPRATAAAAAPRVERSRTAPWVLGIGAGVVLVGVAVTMSRNLSSHEPASPPAAVVGQATPSPEDVQLQSAPPSAGAELPAPEQATPAEPVSPPSPIVEPRSEPTRAVAAAPVESKPATVESKPATVARAAPPAAEPVTRTLTPAPEVLAQASPPPAELQPPPAVTTPAPVQAPAPVAAAPLTPPAVVPPEAAPVVVPPVAQTVPQPPVPVTAPEDAGITVQVRMALANDVSLSSVPIAVSTDHGVVKLEGQAPDAQTRERATVVASAATGVKAVDNRLTLPPATVVSQAPSGL